VPNEQVTKGQKTTRRGYPGVEKDEELTRRRVQGEVQQENDSYLDRRDQAK